MNVQNIGENAGIVWRQLASEHRKWQYDEVKAATGLADRDLNAAIGWLAREGKVEIEESKVGRKTIIYLTLCYYIS
ncbi:MAG TPA: winged helix-turn-helix domain-containing protein [Candidatus Bacteroides pullicola]|uniref:Winged helix-turn-helix domain-containing protein n=2 Tax=Bacteroides TaxID=816 RepID=A0A9D1ZJ90_9BACE|nr:winged helix-turn-helix domain-containing protein [Candidatus Bacteroides pullicola]HIZ33816.1 winged helix-turn-helix domain-containing protein [Candidatus Bacteroides merdigallinarum]